MTATTTTLNLRDFIRETAEQLNTPDPHIVAATVADSLPEDVLREALRLTLPTYARDVMRLRGTGSEMSHPASRNRSRAGRSSANAIGRVYRELIVKSVKLGEDGEWKFLADCTPDDLHAGAEYRLQMARFNEQAAERLGMLALAFSDYPEAKVVADLPEVVVVQVMRDFEEDS